MHTRYLSLAFLALSIALIAGTSEIARAEEKPESGLIFYREGEKVFTVPESTTEATEPEPMPPVIEEPTSPSVEEQESMEHAETDNEWAPPASQESKEEEATKESKESAEEAAEASMKKAAPENGGIDMINVYVYGGGSLLVAVVVFIVFLFKKRKRKQPVMETASPIPSQEHPELRSDRLEKALEAMKEAKA